jgi:hypothetical protein
MRKAQDQRTRRRRLSRDQKEAILKRQKHLCPLCQKPLSGAARIEFDHRRAGLPRWFFTKDPSLDPDDPAFVVALHARCHARLLGADLAAIAKAKRRAGDAGQRARRLRGATRSIPRRRDPWWRG